MDDDQKERLALKVLLIFYIALLIIPHLDQPKYRKTETILVFNIKILENFNLIHLEYYHGKLVSIDGKWVYLPKGERRLTVFSGIYNFQIGHAYELTYRPFIRGYNAQPKILEVKELIH